MNNPYITSAELRNAKTLNPNDAPIGGAKKRRESEQPDSEDTNPLFAKSNNNNNNNNSNKSSDSPAVVAEEDSGDAALKTLLERAQADSESRRKEIDRLGGMLEFKQSLLDKCEKEIKTLQGQKQELEATLAANKNEQTQLRLQLEQAQATIGKHVEHQQLQELEKLNSELNRNTKFVPKLEKKESYGPVTSSSTTAASSSSSSSSSSSLSSSSSSLVASASHEDYEDLKKAHGALVLENDALEKELADVKNLLRELHLEYEKLEDVRDDYSDLVAKYQALADQNDQLQSKIQASSSSSSSSSSSTSAPDADDSGTADQSFETVKEEEPHTHGEDASAVAIANLTEELDYYKSAFDSQSAALDRATREAEKTEAFRAMQKDTALELQAARETLQAQQAEIDSLRRQVLNSTTTSSSGATGGVHVKARGAHPAYPPRFEVPDDKVPFAVEFPEYSPTMFTHNAVLAESAKAPKGWADPTDISAITGLAARMTHVKQGFQIDKTTGMPLNPQGRTGMTGRGLLGRFGPNHAADPIVTRIHNGKVQMVAIKRKDTGEWAIPGGMVDAGEQVSATLRREFEEEAGNVPADQVEAFRKDLDTLFKNGKVVFKGYVDDPRNTDNAWMETVAAQFKCSPELAKKLDNLNAGDDAADVKWLTIDAASPEFAQLYASHKTLVEMCDLSLAEEGAKEDDDKAEKERQAREEGDRKIRELRDRCIELEMFIEQEHSKNIELEFEQSKLRKYLDGANKQVEQLTLKVAETEGTSRIHEEQAKKLGATAQSLLAQNEQLTIDHLGLTEKLERLQQQRQANDEPAAAAAKVAALQEELAKEKESNGSLRARCTSLEAAMREEAAKHSVTTSDLTDKLNRAVGKLKLAELENTSIKAKLESSGSSTAVPQKASAVEDNGGGGGEKESNAGQDDTTAAFLKALQEKKRANAAADAAKLKKQAQILSIGHHGEKKKPTHDKKTFRKDKDSDSDDDMSGKDLTDLEDKLAMSPPQRRRRMAVAKEHDEEQLQQGKPSSSTIETPPGDGAGDISAAERKGLEAATTKIQAAFRGHQVRKASPSKTDSSASSSSSATAAAAVSATAMSNQIEMLEATIQEQQHTIAELEAEKQNLIRHADDMEVSTHNTIKEEVERSRLVMQQQFDAELAHLREKLPQPLSASPSSSAAALPASVRVLEEQLESARRSRSDAESGLNQEKMKFSSELAALQRENDILVGKLKTYEEEEKNRNKRIELLEEKHRMVREERNELQAQVTRLTAVESDLSDERKRVEALEALCKSQAEKLRELQQELLALHQDSGGAKDGAAKDVQEKLWELQEEINALKMKERERGSSIAAATAAVAAGGDAMAEGDNDLKEKLSVFAERIFELEQANAESARKLDAEKNERIRHESFAISLGHALAEAREKLAAVSAGSSPGKVAATAQSSDDVDDDDSTTAAHNRVSAAAAEAEIQTLKQQLRSARQDRNGLLFQMQELRYVKDENIELRAEIQTLTAKLALQASAAGRPPLAPTPVKTPGGGSAVQHHSPSLIESQTQSGRSGTSETPTSADASKARSTTAATAAAAAVPPRASRWARDSTPAGGSANGPFQPAASPKHTTFYYVNTSPRADAAITSSSSSSSSPAALALPSPSPSGVNLRVVARSASPSPMGRQGAAFASVPLSPSATAATAATGATVAGVVISGPLHSRSGSVGPARRGSGSGISAFVGTPPYAIAGPPATSVPVSPSSPSSLEEALRAAPRVSAQGMVIPY